MRSCVVACMFVVCCLFVVVCWCVVCLIALVVRVPCGWLLVSSLRGHFKATLENSIDSRFAPAAVHVQPPMRQRASTLVSIRTMGIVRLIVRVLFVLLCVGVGRVAESEFRVERASAGAASPSCPATLCSQLQQPLCCTAIQPATHAAQPIARAQQATSDRHGHNTSKHNTPARGNTLKSSAGAIMTVGAILKCN